MAFTWGPENTFVSLQKLASAALVIESRSGLPLMSLYKLQLMGIVLEYMHQQDMITRYLSHVWLLITSS